MLSSWNENQHLQVWIHEPQPEKGGLLTPSQGRVTAWCSPLLKRWGAQWFGRDSHQNHYSTIDKSQLRRFGHLTRIPPSPVLGRFFWAKLGKGSRVEKAHTGEIMSWLTWKCLSSPPDEMECPRNPNRIDTENGTEWNDTHAWGRWAIKFCKHSCYIFTMEYEFNFFLN